MISKSELGNIGEKLVSGYFRSEGLVVSRSEDKYDMDKDLIVDGQNVEVKTQTIYRQFPCGSRYEPAFTVSITGDCNVLYSNQLNKCLNSERLIFVSRPSFGEHIVRIYEAPPVGKRYFSITQNNKDGRYVAGFLINTMRILTELHDEKLAKSML